MRRDGGVAVMNPSAAIPEWLPSDMSKMESTMSVPKKASAISTSGRPLMGGKADEMQTVPDFATILDHYAKNQKKISLPARHVYHPEQVGQFKSAVQAGMAHLPNRPVHEPPGPPLPPSSSSGGPPGPQGPPGPPGPPGTQ